VSQLRAEPMTAGELSYSVAGANQDGNFSISIANYSFFLLREKRL